MNNEAIREHITNILPSPVFDETGQWLNVQIAPEDWRKFADQLKAPPLLLDYLFCLTCIDWKTHFTMVYHFSSTMHRNTVVIKINLDHSAPEIATVSDIWKTAEFHEREVYDLFGVRFNGHPDLRRLILTDDFEGYPLRKDFEDPVNMIRL
jgi:NADH:ubiquinone oxidoreductase subunit C